MTTFNNLGVHKEFIQGLKELGIKTPTEIQENVIPTLLKTKTDLIGLAQTGTGKTAAFGLPILHKIDSKKDILKILPNQKKEISLFYKNNKKLRKQDRDTFFSLLCKKISNTLTSN